MNRAPLLEAEGLSMEFSGSRVLRGVDLAVNAGQILGVIGENGAGKSTLLKILAGLYQPSAGVLRWEGRPVQIRDPGAAKRLGICMVPQEFNLVDSLSVAANVFLGSELTRAGWLDLGAMRARTAAILGELEAEVDPEARVGDLSVAQKQLVEVAKALVHQSRVLILDEPTTGLNAAEAAALFALLRRVAERGVALMFVSHRLREVKALCDRVLILRDGEPVATVPAAALSPEDMARAMVGRELAQVFPEKRPPTGDVVLDVEGLCVPGRLADVTFGVRAGEILGLAGLVGAGRTELAETLMGLRRPASGQIRVHGRPARIRSPQQAVRLGLAYLSADRQGRGLIQSFGIAPNVTLASLARYARGLIDRRREQAAAAAHVARFNVRAAALDRPVRYLSGGNQQKVYLAKWLDTEPTILLLDEPTRGIDVGARIEIYRFVRALADRGIACLVISSELEEIIGLCTRVVVMRAGRVAGVLDGAQLREEEIMYYATGLREGQTA